MPDPIMTALADALRDRYRVERELGAGGMATVYLAQDVRHHRRVALKVLRPELAAVIGAKRFLHEIETTANLQHPHILPLHDSGEVGGTAFYVMPFVEGESLRDRLTREKQLPVEEAVRIAGEVASALDYAHRKGVIHRDIKPENILLHEAQALVADFGIALALSTAGGARMTETGLSLGTPHYMSPEQAMGEREITGRSDVYALGCVLYEMLIGDPPFTGSTAQAIVAQVVTEAPRPLTPRRHTIPPQVEAAVLRALEKLPADRFESPGAFAHALLAPGPQTLVTEPRLATRKQRDPMAWIAAGFLGVLLLGTVGYHLKTLPAGARSLVASLLPPAGCAFAEAGSAQLSPDGDALAFVGLCGEDRAIWLRSLAGGESRRIEGTAGAFYPFWAPDGRSLGFFAAGRLKRVDLGSGAIRDLAPAPNGRGGSWNRTGTILFAPDIFGPIYRIPASGGQPDPVTRVAGRGTEVTQRIPYFLPDGTHFLFSEQDARSSSDTAGRVLSGSIGSWETRPVLDRGTNVAYADGFLIFGREGVLLAQPFDPARIRLSGSPLALASELRTYSPRLQTAFSVAGGRLVYEVESTLDTRLDYFNPASGTRTTVLERGPYASLELSRDGRRLLIGRRSRAALDDVWLYEPASGAWSQLSREPRLELRFGWLPDGRRIALHLTDHTVEIRSLDTGASRTFAVPTNTYLVDWASEGFAVGNRQSETTGQDLIMWTRSGDSSTMTPLYATPANEEWPRLSPDGRLLAYISDQSGRPEVYLTTLPGAGRQIQISFEGADLTMGQSPVAWSRDGRRLYWLGSGGTLQSVSIGTGRELHIGKPAPLPAAPKNIVGLAAAPDGRLLLLYDDRSAVAPLTMVENWIGRTPGP